MDARLARWVLKSWEYQMELESQDIANDRLLTKVKEDADRIVETSLDRIKVSPVYITRKP